jgi:hypothetical protein
MLGQKCIKSIVYIGIILALAFPARALDSLIVNISEAAIVVNPADQNDVRILLKIDQINTLDTNRVVMVAQLRSPVNIVNAPNHSILVRANPVAVDWNANSVTWNSPWTNAGGDLLEDLSVLGRLSTGDNQRMKLDVTRIIKRMVSGNIVNHGLMLRQIGAGRRPVTIINSSHPNGGNPLVELVVYYVNRN